MKQENEHTRPKIYRIGKFTRVVGELPIGTETYIQPASWEENWVEGEIIHLGRKGLLNEGGINEKP